MRMKIVLLSVFLTAFYSLVAVNQVLGHFAAPNINNLLVRDTLAIVSSEYDGLRIMDVSEPANPEQIWFFGQQNINGFDVADTLLYISTSLYVKTYNIKNPANPQLIMTNYNASCQQIKIFGDYYISGGSYLSVYDRWTNGSRLWQYDFGLYSGYSVSDFIIADNLLFAAISNLGFMIFDFSNPIQPQLLCTVHTADCWDTPIALHDNIFFYMQNSSGDLVLYDVSNPSNPSIVISYPFNPVMDMVVDDTEQKLFCYSYNTGIKVYDISNPLDLHVDNYFCSTNWYYYAMYNGNIRLQNGFIYITDDLGLRIVQPDLTPDFSLSCFVSTGDFIYGLDWYQDYLYASQTALKIFSLAVPANPVLIGSEASVFDPNYQVRAGDGFAVLRARYYDREDIGWIRYVNTANPYSPFQMGTYWYWYADNLDMDVENNTVYLEADNKLLMVDTSNPDSLTLIGLYNNGNVERFDILNSLAYLCLGTGGVKIVNLANPALPIDLSSFILPQPAVACQTNGIVMAVMTAPQTTTFLEHLCPTQVYLVNVADPANPVVGALLQPRSNNYFNYKMRIYNHILVLCDMLWNRIYLYDISDFNNPVLLREIVSNTNSAEGVIRGDYLYSADGFYGIAVRDISDVFNIDETLPPVPQSEINCFPNPFTGQITVKLNSKSTKPFTVHIYNGKGQLVWKSTFCRKSEFVWNGKDTNGHNTAAGLYLIRVSGEDIAASKKIIKLQ
ncbi:MAG TPA: T9SS type A sorting domain-containing protein [Candidatus Cloacimonadota bacterium]|nr:T9SS type A sorting domain-containing protein [Candidatus Cloacimonadota bacterium]